MAEVGATGVLGDRGGEKLNAVIRKITDAGGPAVAAPGVVWIPEDCHRLVSAAVEQFDRVDILVNNAGKGTAFPATRETPEQFREVIDVNLNGCYWMAQEGGRVMKPGSWIGKGSSILGPPTRGLPQ